MSSITYLTQTLTISATQTTKNISKFKKKAI